MLEARTEMLTSQYLVFPGTNASQINSKFMFRKYKRKVRALDPYI